ncbi:MAG TPA: hypothetical protein VGB19_09510 [Actinomycetota bacterium]
MAYSSSAAPVTINLATNGASGGDASGDTISGFEGVTGSPSTDVLLGTAGDNLIIGGGGGDIMVGGEGNDSLNYAASPAGVTIDLAAQTASGGDATGDTIAGFASVFGTAGRDHLLGSSGRNTFRPGGRADVVDGRAGIDTVDYSTSSAAVLVDLGAGSASGGDASGDTLTALENVTGSVFGDSLTGDVGDNALKGKAGNDALDGGLGIDALDGGDGTDTCTNGETVTNCEG